MLLLYCKEYYLLVYFAILLYFHRMDTKIAIIGAGIAGMKIASLLQSKGYENIKIFEAMNRIGGRIETQFYTGFLRFNCYFKYFKHFQLNNINCLKALMVLIFYFM